MASQRESRHYEGGGTSLLQTGLDTLTPVSGRQETAAVTHRRAATQVVKKPRPRLGTPHSPGRAATSIDRSRSVIPAEILPVEFKMEVERTLLLSLLQYDPGGTILQYLELSLSTHSAAFPHVLTESARGDVIPARCMLENLWRHVTTSLTTTGAAVTEVVSH
ncbi:hypothetical protein Bbelb_070710 [Branchiostoma belcheri]|nr:hypothetical protein Bbelb_070710 [Branchiostoma belcheri]